VSCQRLVESFAFVEARKVERISPSILVQLRDTVVIACLSRMSIMLCEATSRKARTVDDIGVVGISVIHSVILLQVLVPEIIVGRQELCVAAVSALWHGFQW